MRAHEVVRFHCGDCQIIFGLCIQGERETEYTEGASPIDDYGEPSPVCPFCGANELARMPDDPIITGPWRRPPCTPSGSVHVGGATRSGPASSTPGGWRRVTTCPTWPSTTPSRWTAPSTCSSGRARPCYALSFSTGDNVWASRARSQQPSGCLRYTVIRWPASCVSSPPARGTTDNASRLRV